MCVLLGALLLAGCSSANAPGPTAAYRAGHAFAVHLRLAHPLGGANVKYWADFWCNFGAKVEPPYPASLWEPGCRAGYARSPLG